MLKEGFALRVRLSHFIKTFLSRSPLAQTFLIARVLKHQLGRSSSLFSVLPSQRLRLNGAQMVETDVVTTAEQGSRPRQTLDSCRGVGGARWAMKQRVAAEAT
jgi:hypothetical protein